MRLIRLAKLLEFKYGAEKPSAPINQVLGQIINNIQNVYNLYVNFETANNNSLQIVADSKLPFAVELLDKMSKLMIAAKKSEPLQPADLFRRIKEILDLITVTMGAPKSPTRLALRQSIKDTVKIKRQSDYNYRERLMSKFEDAVDRINSILQKQARILKAFVPEEASVGGGNLGRTRMDLSKEKRLMFMKTPAAQKYGLDNFDVMTRLLSYPDLREKVTTLINAIDRGHLPVDGPEIMAETADIKALFDQKDATNESSLEAGEDEFQQTVRQNVLSPAEDWSRQMQESKQEKGQERAEEEAAELAKQRMQPLIQQRDLEHEKMKKKQLEQDLINKYNGLTLEKWMRS